MRRPAPYYERIEPVAESFGDLDPAIDLRDRRCRRRHEWTGFHPIEQALFETKTTDGADELADQLVADVADLQTRPQELGANTRADADADRYLADEVANGAVALLGEVQASKITGEEEAYSHIDLLDFSGQRRGFAAGVCRTQAGARMRSTRAVVPDISTKFDDLHALLDTYRDRAALGGFVLYTDLSPPTPRSSTDGLLAVIRSRCPAVTRQDRHGVLTPPRGLQTTMINFRSSETWRVDVP